MLNLLLFWADSFVCVKRSSEQTRKGAGEISGSSTALIPLFRLVVSFPMDLTAKEGVPEVFTSRLLSIRRVGLAFDMVIGEQSKQSSWANCE